MIDDQGHFQRAYDLAIGDWLLVRPDGYIGAIVASEHLEKLVAYLSQVSPQPIMPE